MSDKIAEAKLRAQISDLERDAVDMQTRHELNQNHLQHISDRLTRVEDLLASADMKNSQLSYECKNSENRIKDLQEKKKTDEMLWRIREMELLAQLTEERQKSAQLECVVEELQASKQLQMKQSMMSSFSTKNGSLETLSLSVMNGSVTTENYL
ncbi:ecotropic viral integration site, partial [Cichlidogyrus casuarinus]